MAISWLVQSLCQAIHNLAQLNKQKQHPKDEFMGTIQNSTVIKYNKEEKESAKSEIL